MPRAALSMTIHLNIERNRDFSPQAKTFRRSRRTEMWVKLNNQASTIGIGNLDLRSIRVEECPAEHRLLVGMQWSHAESQNTIPVDVEPVETPAWIFTAGK